MGGRVALRTSFQAVSAAEAPVSLAGAAALADLSCARSESGVTDRPRKTDAINVDVNLNLWVEAMRGRCEIGFIMDLGCITRDREAWQVMRRATSLLSADR